MNDEELMLDEYDSGYDSEYDSEFASDAEYSAEAKSGSDDIDDSLDDDADEEEVEEKKYAPLLPFDISYGEQFLLYDNMPYICDTDRCNASMIKMESGNVCKFYRCKEVKPAKVGGD